jgi:hypothetical protein
VECGLLFGRVHGEITEIHDFQAASNGNLRNLVADSAQGPKEHLLVGYYRTQPEATLRLNQNDLSLAKSLFTEPFHVFLVIQSTGFIPGNASFFFRSDGRSLANFPLMEFPFDSSLLAAEERSKAERLRPVEIEEPVAVMPMAPFAIPPVAPVAVSPMELVAVPIAQPVPVPAVKRHTRTRSRVAWVCFVLCILAAAAWLAWRFIPETLSIARNGPARPLPALIGLHMERQSADLVLNWNRRATPIANATSGVLFIQDGDATRQISLDATQVREGSILYSPATDQVQMRLTVTSPAGDTTESVTALLPRTGLPPVKAADPPKPSSAPVRASVPVSAPAALPVPPPASSELRPPMKPFAPPDSRRTEHPSTATTIDDAPALNIAPNPGTAGSAALPSPQRTPPVPVKPTAPQGQTPPAAATAYHPPVAINKVLPEFPPILKPIVLTPKTVEVRVNIDVNGKVVKAEAIPQKGVNKLMIDAATHAAQFWRFRPALNGDQPVPSEMLLAFTFKQ